MDKENSLVTPEKGKVYDGKVVTVTDFGAFVDFGGAKDGLVHISEIRHGRVNNIRDELRVGDDVKVKVLDYDDRGKVRLSIKAVEEE